MRGSGGIARLGAMDPAGLTASRIDTDGQHVIREHRVATALQSSRHG